MASIIGPFGLALMFLLYSVPLFLGVLSTSKSVIDEEFHLRQGLHFCNKRFDVWDPKITTFPGLYLFSLVLNPLNMCSMLGLRLISLAAATVNVVLIYKIRVCFLGGSHAALAALEAFTLAALPPLYFFSHVYYTDALSLTTVLLLYHYWGKQMHLHASVYGAASVLMRQTNIVWLGMLFGITALDVLAKNYADAENKASITEVSLFDFKTWFKMLTSFRVLGRSICCVLLKCSCYLIIILPFIGFVFLNGAIVLGDKSAHNATLHLPQALYFSLFAAAFSPSYIVLYLRSALSLMRRNQLITIFAVGVFILIVKWNTLVHPYLLADNRHYTFYLWNRLYGRYSWFKYAMTPIYAIAFLILHQALQRTRDSFKIMFWSAVLVALCFQRLLEVRYFLVPFVLLRLNALPITQRRNHKNSMFWHWLELCFYIAINAATFYIFFKKEIIWSNFKEPQRIIW